MNGSIVLTQQRVRLYMLNVSKPLSTKNVFPLESMRFSFCQLHLSLDVQFVPTCHQHLLKYCIISSSVPVSPPSSLYAYLVNTVYIPEIGTGLLYSVLQICICKCISVHHLPLFTEIKLNLNERMTMCVNIISQSIQSLAVSVCTCNRCRTVCNSTKVYARKYIIRCLKISSCSFKRDVVF